MRLKRKKKLSDEAMQQLFERFAKERKLEMVDLGDCHEWAEANGLWSPPDLSPKSIFKLHMSQALSRERIWDDDGNPVRPKLSLKVKRDDGQGYFYFWGQMLQMSPEKVKLALQQRLLSLANRAIQLDRDKTYYNEKNAHGAQLDLNYDLTTAVENSKHSDEYPDERPEGEN